MSLSQRLWRVLLPAVLAASLFPLAARASGVQPLPPVTAADSRLGLCDVLPGSAPSGESWAQLAYDAGARYNRWEIRWDQVEKKHGQFDFSTVDPAVQDSLDAGLKVLGILIGTPSWAGHAGNGVPKGLTLPPSNPGNLWASYVRATVSHYQGQIHAWEIWNEPDIAFFWQGTADQYYRLLQVAYTVIKEIDPNARVLMAGMVVPGLAFFRQVIHDAATDPSHASAFDVAAWHAYGNTQPLYTNILAMRAALNAAGFTQTPIWVTEDGFPASNPNGQPRQAAYVLQTIAYAFAAGAQRVFIYRASDDSTPKHWGLMDATGAPRPGYVAFQVASSYFAGVTNITYLPGTSVESFALYSPGRRVTLLWNRSAQDNTLTLPAAGPSADLVDWAGNVSSVASAGGLYHLILPGATFNAGIDPTNAVVGGPPVLLVESNKVPGGLTSRTYVGTVSGPGRSLALVNAGTNPLAVNVASARSPKEHVSLSVPAGSVSSVNLDLLAGPGYEGNYVVRSNGLVAVEAGSSKAIASVVQSSATWFVPGRSPVTLYNPMRQTVTVKVAGYTHGHKAMQSTISLAPLATHSWTPPKIAASIMHSSQPIVLNGAVSQLATSWYSVHPAGGHLGVFNPGKSTASVDVHFVGSSSLVGQQLRLAPHRSFNMGTHGARAVIINASRSLAVGAGASSQATTQAAIPVVGPTRRVTVFNPSAQAAHVTYTALTPSGTTARSFVVKPSHLSNVAAPTSPGPKGVIIDSDVPVVSAPAS